MVIYIKGDIFASSAEVLVNPVNLNGAMGKGLAKEFKTRYPEMFTRYKKLCQEGQMQIGKLWIYKTPQKWVLNFPTKKHWGDPSELAYIQAGLEKFVDSYQQQGIKQAIAFPRLGCGNGQLDWPSQVKPMMEHYLSDLPIAVFVYYPGEIE